MPISRHGKEWSQHLPKFDAVSGQSMVKMVGYPLGSGAEVCASFQNFNTFEVRATVVLFIVSGVYVPSLGEVRNAFNDVLTNHVLERIL